MGNKKSLIELLNKHGACVGMWMKEDIEAAEQEYISQFILSDEEINAEALKEYPVDNYYDENSQMRFDRREEVRDTFIQALQHYRELLKQMGE